MSKIVSMPIWHKVNIRLVWLSGRLIAEFDIEEYTRIKEFVRMLEEGVMEDNGVRKIRDRYAIALCDMGHYELLWGTRKLESNKYFKEYRIPDGADITLVRVVGADDG